MATKIVRGDAQNQAQVSIFTPPASYSTGDIFRFTINKNRVEYTVVSGDGDSDVVAGIVAAWNDAAAAEIGEVDATEDGAQVTFTAADAGVPFHLLAEHLDSDETVLASSLKISFFLRNSPTGGDFTITFDGQTTGTIAYNANASTVQTALEGLSNIASGDVTASGGPLPDTAVVLTFAGRWDNREIPLITIDESGLTGGDATITITETTKGVPNQNHQTQIRFKDSPTGGNFQLVVDGTITGDIAYNASAATVASAVEALPAFASGDISGSGGPLPGTAVTITFGGSAAGQSFTVDLIESDLTGFSVSASVTTVQDGSPSATTPERAWFMEAVPAPDELGSTRSLRTTSGFSSPVVDGADPVISGSSSWDFGSSLDRLAEGDGDIATLPEVEDGQTREITLWVKPSSLEPNGNPDLPGNSGHNLILSRMVSPADVNDPAVHFWAVTHDGSGNVHLHVAVGFTDTEGGPITSRAFRSITSSQTLEVNAWNQVYVGVRNVINDEGGVRLFIAVSRASQSAPTPITSQFHSGDELVDSGEGFLYLGGTNFGGYTGAAADYKGKLDELYIFTGAFVAATVVQDEDLDVLFNGGDGARWGAGQNEIQDVDVAGTPTEGTFDLTVTTASGTDTATVDYDEDAAGLQSKLVALSNVGTDANGDDNVSVSGSALPGGTLTVEFVNDLGETDIQEMSADDFDLQVAVTDTQTGNPGTNEVQTIEITGVSDKSDVHDGTFTLTSPGSNTTGNLDHDATNAAIETALEGLADITDVVLTGGPIASAPVLVEFAGTNANTDVNLMTATPSLDSGQGDVTGALDLALDTASAGEHHFDDPDNYDDGTLPAAGDTIVVDGAELFYGLDFLRGQAVDIKIYAGRVGLPYENRKGYVEYRVRRATAKWDVIEIGTAGGAGPRRAFLDYEDASDPVVTVHAAQGSSGSPAVDVVGNSGNATVYEVRAGTVAIAPRDDESDDFASLTVYGGEVQLGPAVTADNGAGNFVVEVYGGEVYMDNLQIKNNGRVKRLRD